jgi:hypothetical protein
LTSFFLQFLGGSTTQAEHGRKRGKRRDRERVSEKKYGVWREKGIDKEQERQKEKEKGRQRES